MNKKKAIKVLSATAIAASAFVATAPVGTEAAASDVQTLVKKAKDAGTVLKWAISTEGSADGKTRPYAQYNAAKAARDAAVAAINKLPAAQKAGYLADIEQNVTLHINRTMAYIDAITAGEKISAKKATLEAQIEKNLIDDNTEAAYHALSSEIRKQAILLDRVYGQSTRDEIRAQYKKSAEAVRDSVKFEVSAKIELDLAKKALDANNEEQAEKHLAEAAKHLADVKNATMKTALVKTLDELEAKVTPKVKSVSALNAKELVVTFNQAVDATDAALTGKYSVEGEVISKAEVSKDGKTVTLTTADELNVTSAKVTVSAIKTKDDAKVLTTAYNTLLTFADTTPVAVKSVEAKGTTAVITFDEPVQSEGTVSLDGAELAAERFSLSLDGKTLTINGLTAEKSYKVDIVGATDYANNIANPIAVNFTVAKPVVDNSKPTVSTTVNGTEITFNFSEELSLQNLDATAGDDEFAKVTVGSDTFYLKAAQQDQEDNTKFVLDASSALGSSKFINTKVKVEGHKDQAGNAGEAFEFNATLVTDTTAPKFVSASTKMVVADDTAKTDDVDALYLTFDEPVNVKGNLTLKSKNGIVYTNATPVSVDAAAGFDVDGNGKVEGSEKNTVKIDVDLDSNSSYTFELAGGSVKDLATNPIADTLTINVTTGTFQAEAGKVEASLAFAATPVVVSAENNNVFTVEYAADVTASATSASNYTLGGKALPAGTQLQFVDGTKKVRVTLPAGSITANGKYVLEVKNVVDTKGNTLVDGKLSTQVELKESVVPTATKVTVLNSKSFTVDFSETIANQASATGLTVKIAGTTVEASAAAANGKLTVTTEKDFSLTDSISVEFKSTNLVDANGNKVQDGVITK
ncbi:S-layer homology domain-containing protein [Bacillus sp. DTU_2020_1000418_1_SI_GHA_SEK_038]|uniref:S-layer homology domain-containing protein n=1 Tax=Bacillus sp. DTU_2020_1000418_1_SI_GHA_SEK_038 TaxID=3077585 RepID=UPI0028E912EC|nr:S-layer homology domain-containing protein [Bacillus sp. DTU_2020_1000418_1_SI_GHA_SEK_038]WNS75219.1 S-layer homology domain-containing protein [Bacillus sp. DTU_2020_1000418_1_SI_GHA_SEK_038]